MVWCSTRNKKKKKERLHSFWREGFDSSSLFLSFFSLFLVCVLSCYLSFRHWENNSLVPGCTKNRKEEIGGCARLKRQPWCTTKWKELGDDIPSFFSLSLSLFIQIYTSCAQIESRINLPTLKRGDARKAGRRQRRGYTDRAMRLQIKEKNESGQQKF